MSDLRFVTRRLRVSPSRFQATYAILLYSDSGTASPLAAQRTVHSGIRKTSSLDAKTDLLTGLLAGKQGWKCPVALLATCCGSKSLKVILIDSDFRATLSSIPLSHCNLPRLPGRIFSKVKTSFPTKPLTGLAGHQRWEMEECSARLVQTFPDLQKNWSIPVF